MGMLEPAHAHTHYFRRLVEGEAAIGFVAVPQSERLPCAVFLGALFSGDDLAAHPGLLAGQVEGDAGIHTGDEELVRA